MSGMEVVPLRLCRHACWWVGRGSTGTSAHHSTNTHPLTRTPGPFYAFVHDTSSSRALLSAIRYLAFDAPECRTRLAQHGVLKSIASIIARGAPKKMGTGWMVLLAAVQVRLLAGVCLLG